MQAISFRALAARIRDGSGRRAVRRGVRAIHCRAGGAGAITIWRNAARGRRISLDLGRRQRRAAICAAALCAALPSGDVALTGSLLLDDAELGAHGSASLRDGKLVLDLTASGGVMQAPLDDGKRALYPQGKAPARVDSAGFATMRAVLDPATLDGAAQRYQTNVVTGHHVQGPMYANSVMRRKP